MYLKWTNPNPDILGFVSMMLDDEDKRSAEKQLNDGYQHGGGFSHFNGFTLSDDWQEVGKAKLLYSGDPPTRELSRGKLRDETVIAFEHAWFAVVQPDGSFVVSRMD